jgi:hypothetical protein
MIRERRRKIEWESEVRKKERGVTVEKERKWDSMIEKNRGVYYLRHSTSPYLSSWMATSAERSSEVWDSRCMKYCFVDSTSCSLAFLSCVRAVCTSLEHCTYASRSHEWIGIKDYERWCGQRKDSTIC